MGKYAIFNHETLLNRCITWLMRLIVGGTFVFSGFSKGIDPWGTLYKFNDYLAAAGVTLWPNLVLTGVFALICLEFLVGVFLITGCFRRSSAIVANLIMWFMLPLTLWIAISDPVADCGCFGDAFIISNWATFWKNVVLTICAAWLLIFNRYVFCLVTPSLQWLAFLVSGFYISGIGLAGYLYQPLIDFRQYKVGEPLIVPDSNSDSEADDYVFIYEKDGVEKEFGIEDELPDEADGWHFVDRKMLSQDNQDAKSGGKEKSFRLWDAEGDDVTEDVLKTEGKQLILFMPALGNVSIASTWQINSLYDWTVKNGIEMFAVVSGSDEEIANWEDLSMPAYPIYQADDTAIKEIVRGNPAVVLTIDGIVKWKSSLRALDNDDFLAPGTSQNPMSFARDDRRILLNSTYLYLSIMAVLIVLSMLPRLKNVYGRRFGTSNKKITRDDTAPREE